MKTNSASFIYILITKLFNYMPFNVLLPKDISGEGAQKAYILQCFF